MSISRREMMSGVLAGAAAASVLGAPAQAREKKTLKTYPNSHFYKADGAFDQEAAREAYYEMFAFHNYPIVPRLKTEEFWVADFGLGNFAEVGMGGVFWVNNQRDNYFGHEIFLFSGQMIPEHSHVKLPTVGPKMEAWQVRHGSVKIYGEGAATPGVDERIPPMHQKIAKARKEQELLPGDVGELAEAEQWHWMIGGDQGGIVTEYATYHDGAALRFSHPDIKF
jgi:D-lyxose ketol-isomerase